MARLSRSVREDLIDNIGSVMGGTGISREDYSQSIHSLEYVSTYFRSRYLNILKTATLNGKAPNPEVILLDGQTRRKLLDFGKKDRPLVLNFGSCT